MHDPKHPIWLLARQGLLCSVAVFALWFNYDKMDGRDVNTVLQILAGLFGFDMLQRKLTATIDPNQNKKDDQ